MRRSLFVSWVAVLAVVALPVAAQEPVEVLPAQLSIPFGVVDGDLVIIGDRLVFVHGTDSSESFAVARSTVSGVERRDDIITLSVRRAGGASGPANELSFRTDGAARVADWVGARGAAPAARATDAGSGRPAAGAGSADSFQARHDHRIGSCLGSLILMEDRLAFESVSDLNDSRQWVYADIREVNQDGIYKISITPFLGNEYNLELIGRGMDSEQYRTLVQRVANARAR